jgi:DNA-binding MarR family transcriptional regulator
MIAKLYQYEVESLANYISDRNRVSIFADSEFGLSFLQSLIEGMKIHSLYAGMMTQGIERLNNFVTGDAIIVDIASDNGASQDQLLDRINALALIDSLPIIVNTTNEFLDSVAARLSAPSVTLMCKATTADWIASLAVIGARSPVALHDIALDESMRLQQIAEEVRLIAKTLSDLVGSNADEGATGFRAGTTPYTASRVTSVNAADVRAIIRLRRLRDRYFRSDLFADPAWDMLLDLMAARLERMRVAVSSLCIAAAVPPTTALRWIKTMCDHGLFVRVADPEDGRRVFIELSEGAATAMTTYLSAAKAAGGLAV